MLRKWEKVQDRVRACDKHPRRKTTLSVPPSASAIVSPGDNPWTTWQVKFCIHGSGGGYRRTSKWTVCTFCFDFKEDLQQSRNIHLNICQYSSSTRPPTLGMDLCAPRLIVRAYSFPIYMCVCDVHKRAARDADVWSLSQVFSIHFYNLTARAPLSTSTSLDVSGKFFFFCTGGKLPIEFAKYTLLTV